MNKLQKNAINCALGAALVIGVSLIASPSQAQTFEEEVEKVNVMSDTIAGIVATMTDVAILPMGISASMKTFRHIVLANV